MRALIALSVFCIGTSALCQNVASQPSPSSLQEVIRSALERSAIDGHIQKQLGKMGDAAGVSITKVLAEKAINENDVKIVLALLRLSFADPGAVETVADREPRTALFVLRLLDQYTQDMALKRDIADTKAYVKQQFRQYEK